MSTAITKRIPFWSTLFKKQPIENGVPDPVEAAVNASHDELKEEASSLVCAIRQVVDKLNTQDDARTTIPLRYAPRNHH